MRWLSTHIILAALYGIIMQVYPPKHICDKSLYEIIKIQSPLNKLDGLHLVFYGCYYPDNTGFMFYTNKAYWLIRTSLNVPFQGTYEKDGIYPWVDFHSSSFIKISEDFGIFCPINFIQSSNEPTGKEIFTFAFSHKKNPGISFYFNHLEMLIKFAEYFKVQAKTLIKQAYETRVPVPTHLTSTKNEEQSYENTIKELINNFSLPAEYLMEDNILSKLTNKEMLCLCYYLMGKTAAEIANILKLSPKTTASHLYNARLKLECKNKSELFQKAFELGLIDSQFIRHLTSKKTSS